MPCRFGAEDIQLAAQIHDNLTSRPDPMAQVKQHGFLQIVLCHLDCLLSDKRCLIGPVRRTGL
jgi:hypothetical protein